MKKVLKKIITLGLVLTIALSVAIPTEAATVKINKKSVTLIEGKKTTLKITGTKSKATWKTSKKTVATVTSKGVVTAKKQGTATITARVGGKNYACKITVIKQFNYDTMVAKAYDWTVSIWNDSFCDIYHYVENGIGSVGQKVNVDKLIATASKYMKERKQFDDCINSLNPTKYKEIKNLWNGIKKESDYLYKRIKEEKPITSEDYEFEYQDFNSYMWELLNCAFQ